MTGARSAERAYSGAYLTDNRVLNFVFIPLDCSFGEVVVHRRENNPPIRRQVWCPVVCDL